MVKYLRKESNSSLLQQLQKILEKQPRKKKQFNWDKFFGKVKFEEDPVQYQRRLRDEWR